MFVKIIFSTILLLALFLNSSAQSQKAISLSAVGDIMPGTLFPSKIYLPPNDNCAILFENAKPFIQSSDIAFGNLEGSYLDEGPVVKKCNDTTKCYAFRSPEKYFGDVVAAGFTMFSMANNHSFDFGELAVLKTFQLADSFQVAVAGPLSRPYAIVERNNLKIGLTAFAPNKGTQDMNDYSLIRSIVGHLDTLCDIVVFSFHGGAEGAQYQSVTKLAETFYGENRGNVYEIARVAIDAGADVVLGHGPHVLRAFDLYKNRFIAYSLGNFCTPVRMNLKGANGLSVVAQLNLTKNGEFIDGQIVPFVQDYGKGPVYDPQKGAIKKIKQLTESDLSESPIRISDEGVITYK